GSRSENKTFVTRAWRGRRTSFRWPFRLSATPRPLPFAFGNAFGVRAGEADRCFLPRRGCIPKPRVAQRTLGLVRVAQRTRGAIGTGLPRLKRYPMFPAWFTL